MRKIIFMTALFASINAYSLSVEICADDGEWPPYEYKERKNGKTINKVVGFNIDVLHKIFDKHKIKFNTTMVPWKRCITNVKRGTEYVSLLPTSLNDERRRSFYASGPVYTISPAIFYLKKSFPKGINTSDPAKFFELGNVCGRHGYNYTNFGVNTTDVIREFSSFASAFRALKLGRCDIFLARYEIIAGFRYVGGVDLITEEVEFKAISSVPKEGFHFLTSKRHKDGKRIHNIISNGLTALEKSGELEKMLKKYFKDKE